jgi:hypothetical protein
VALAGGVFGEKYIARMEGHAAAIADCYIDTAGERDHPTPVGRAVEVDNMGREVISQKQPLSFACLVKKLRCLARIEAFEMRLTVVS